LVNNKQPYFFPQNSALIICELALRGQGTELSVTLRAELSWIEIKSAIQFQIPGSAQ
jgi:hypothetical protein